MAHVRVRPAAGPRDGVLHVLLPTMTCQCFVRNCVGEGKVKRTNKHTHTHTHTHQIGDGRMEMPHDAAKIGADVATGAEHIVRAPARSKGIVWIASAAAVFDDAVVAAGALHIPLARACSPGLSGSGLYGEMSQIGRQARAHTHRVAGCQTPGSSSQSSSHGQTR